MREELAAEGAWGRVEWAIDARGQRPARSAFLALSDGDKAKMIALFSLLANTGRISNREKFKCLGESGGNLWEFKSHQLRFLGDFRPGRRFLVAHFVRKKSDRHQSSDIGHALRIMREDDDAKQRGRV